MKLIIQEINKIKKEKNMLIEGVFSSKVPEKITHKFYVGSVRENLTIFLKKCVFEHVIAVLRDPAGRIRGTFTLKTYSRIYSIFKEFNRTSNLFKEGSIESGEWSLTLIKNYGCQGEYSIEVLEDIRTYEGNLHKEIKDVPKGTEKEWYFGELHCHSNFSDGKISQLELYKGYEKKKLDYLFLTDHNVISNKGIDKEWNLFSGTELTLDDNGHFNIYGLKEIDYEKLFSEKRKPNENVEYILQDIRKNGESLISLNHPFQKNTGLITDMPMGIFHTMEIINGPYKEDEEMIKKTIHAFDYLWGRGYRIFGVAGSDTHKAIKGYETTIGLPKNVTNLKEEFSQKALLEAIKEGKNYITFDEGLEIKISSAKKRYTLGDEVQEKVNYSVKSEDKIYWKGILNGRVIFKEFTNEVNSDLWLKEGEYFRVEGYNSSEEIRYFLNPIYNKIELKEEISWFNVIDYINRGE